ncbi:MAG: hypothetical protein LBB43_00280 [Spirochaetaceae bacterium]|jgi:hypothetical protein|nr:hypothetical protein [Spirochaetaceae bacterium]
MEKGFTGLPTALLDKLRLYFGLKRSEAKLHLFILHLFCTELWRENGAVFRTNLQAMRNFDGIEKPALTLTEEEFDAAGGLLRIINGEIFLSEMPNVCCY